MRRYRLWVLGALLAGCGAESGDVATIQNVVAPDASCAFQSTATTYIPMGWYDPQGQGRFAVYVQIINNMKPPTSDAAVLQGTPGREVRTQSNDIMVDGFDICWFDTTDVTFGTTPPDCATLPAAQRRFAPSSGLVPQSGNKLVAHFDALYFADLSAIGFTPAVMGTGGSVTIRTQMVGRTPDGRQVRSAWFNYPVNVCAGCVLEYCRAKFPGVPDTCLSIAGCMPYQLWGTGPTCTQITATPTCP